MRASLAKSTTGWLALAIVWSIGVVANPTRGQESPSLAAAISSEYGEIWNGDSAAVMAPPSSGEYPLEPMPDGVDPNAVGGGPMGEACAGCNGGSGGVYQGFAPYNRCGCSSQLFPYTTGPGNCDNWCVGPHWEVSLDALFIRRDSADWGRIIDDVGLAPDLVDQFHHGPGARLFVTGYNCGSYGLQVGYEGVNDFAASALFPQVGSLRAFSYESTFNSIEVNLFRRTERQWKVFGGARYVEIDEDFVDFTTVDKPLPPPSDPPAASVAFIDSGNTFLVENRLMGVQLGTFRDAWRLNRWITIEPFGNAGVYLNDFKRENIARTVTTVATGDDLATPGSEATQTVTQVNTVVRRDFTDMAFLGEAGVTAVVRLNRCVAVRAGYQALATDGVGQGLDAFFASGLNPDRLFYHGAQFGIEYVR